MNNLRDEIRSGNESSFIDREVRSNPLYRPQVISNDYREGRKVISTLIDELRDCQEFIISVAFITLSGITPLLQVLKELEEKGVPGRILTTDYLTFSEPRALEKLRSLKNIELRMYRTRGNQEGFHTKGYIFRNNDSYRIIIGSSNLTQNAVTVNKEWNTRVITTEQGDFKDSIKNEFYKLWNDENTVSYNSICLDYAARYQAETLRKLEIQDIIRKTEEDQRKIVSSSEIPDLFSYKLSPNSMQAGFIRELELLVESGEKRALLISATGTGKTYASAFALRHLKASRVLFIVHREQIARQALLSFRRVFGNNVTMGILSGNAKDTDAQFVFATRQTISKDHIMKSFSPYEFDHIVIDEVHNAGSESYLKIMAYFSPKLYLGMTASPERMDGFDIYGLFHHNIAYEIRLGEALEEDLLCPFHYFGITDLVIDDESMDDYRIFRHMDIERRCRYITEKITYFGYSGNRVKGLMFVSTRKDAEELSAGLNSMGLRTIALTGENSQEERLEAIARLTSDSRDDVLDYIITVDVFNEGVDIPEINQVVLLRPTESPVIFVQQLGRGLRKFENKEFVVIVDFIGNYRNNYMIPMALFGDRSYNKDNVRRTVIEGTRIIPGASTISFDEISRRRIFESIDSANFSEARIIYDSYRQLKNKIGRIPDLMDFEKYGSIDVLRIFENSTFKSYHNFLRKKEKDYHKEFDTMQVNMLDFISQKLAAGKRPHELIALRLLLNGTENLFEDLRRILSEEYGIKFSERTRKNLISILTNRFPAGTGAMTYAESVFIEERNGTYVISESFRNALSDRDFRRMSEETVDFGLYRNKARFSNYHGDTSFNLYEKYTYDDVMRYLEWEKGEVAQNIGGYKFHRETMTYPVFINYHKEDHIADTIKYEDRFLGPGRLIAISKSGRTLKSNDVQTALNADRIGVAMHLFVRKNKDDQNSKEFYYLGPIHATGWTEEITMGETGKKAVEIEYELETPVREDLYQFILS